MEGFVSYTFVLVFASASLQMYTNASMASMVCIILVEQTSHLLSTLLYFFHCAKVDVLGLTTSPVTPYRLHTGDEDR